MAKEVKKDTIHADGIDIGVYTTDYVNQLHYMHFTVAYMFLLLQITAFSQVVL